MPGQFRECVRPLYTANYLSDPTFGYRIQETYAKEYSKFKPDKKLMWMSHLGTIKLEVELDDGRVVAADVPPLEAAFIELFSEKGLTSVCLFRS